MEAKKATQIATGSSNNPATDAPIRAAFSLVFGFFAGLGFKALGADTASTAGLASASAVLVLGVWDFAAKRWLHE